MSKGGLANAVPECYNAERMMEMLYNLTLTTNAEIPWLFPVAFALFGACVGSFLNVVIYRMPLGMSVSEPRRSFCPQCKKLIPWYLNLPIISWLVLRGRSACCSQRISVRYWLVEVACAALFAFLAWWFAHDNVLTVALLCAWAALMLATFFMDWEQMVVMPSLTVGAAVCGLLTSALSPWVVSPMAQDAADGVLAGLSGALGGYVLFRLVGLLGRLLFGRKKADFARPQTWSVRQSDDGEDIVLQLGDTTFMWSDLFMERANRMVLKGATEQKYLKESGDIILCAEAMRLPDGTEVSLESVQQLSGTCSGYAARKEAMGSGDAWIALAIGALCGWSGVIFALVVGSVIGILAAAVARIGRGVPMPFGPALITAAFIWLIYGVGNWELYLIYH